MARVAAAREGDPGVHHDLGEPLGLGSAAGEELCTRPVEQAEDEGQLDGVAGAEGSAHAGGDPVEAVHEGALLVRLLGLGEPDGGNAEDAVGLDGEEDLARQRGVAFGARAAIGLDHGVRVGELRCEPLAEARLVELRDLGIEEAEELPLVARRAREQRDRGGVAGPDRVEGLHAERVVVDEGLEGQEAQRGAELEHRLAVRVEELVGGQLAQHARRVGGGHAEGPEEVLGDLRGGVAGVHVVRRATLGDRLREVLPGGGHAEQGGHAHAARRLAEDRHVRRVAPETLDVLVHPGEGRDLVAQAGIAHRTLEVGAEVGEVEEAEGAEAVVDRHHHRVAAARQRDAVVEGLCRGADHEAAAVDPHQHRAAAGVGGRGEDVERETVLVELADLHAGQRDREGSLGRAEAEGLRLAHAAPGLGGLGRTEAQLADRGAGEGNAPEGQDAVLLAALEPAVARLDPGTHACLLA